MKKILAFALLFIMLFTLCSCGSGGNKKLTGKWDKSALNSTTTRGPYYLVFYSDGTYTSDDTDLQGTYSVEGNQMRMEKKWADDLNVTFEVQGNTLVIEYWYGTNYYERVED